MLILLTQIVMLDGMVVDNWGRYVRLDVHLFGSPARHATIWGKRVSGEAYSGAMQLGWEGNLRLGIQAHQWRWKPDLCGLRIQLHP